LIEFAEIGIHVKLDAFAGSGQSDASNEQYDQSDVGKEGGDVHGFACRSKARENVITAK
jgi:hypothetical protein